MIILINIPIAQLCLVSKGDSDHIPQPKTKVKRTQKIFSINTRKNGYKNSGKNFGRNSNEKICTKLDKNFFKNSDKMFR